MTVDESFAVLTALNTLYRVSENELRLYEGKVLVIIERLERYLRCCSTMIRDIAGYQQSCTISDCS